MKKVASELLQKTLSTYLKGVNNSIQDANTTVKQMAKGQVQDIHEVMSAVEKANMGFELVIEIQNKLASNEQTGQTQV